MKQKLPNEFIINIIKENQNLLQKNILYVLFKFIITFYSNNENR